MTKYEEMPLDTQVKAGDRVTMSGPSEGELTTRIVREDGYVFVTGNTANTVDRLANSCVLVLRKIERPIPEVELPTVPGYYEAPQFPLSEGLRPYLLSRQGQWYSNGGKVTEERMRELMPLARLVPETETTPAKLADRLDVEKLVDLLRRNAGSITGYYGDAEALVVAIDNGELDK